MTHLLFSRLAQAHPWQLLWPENLLSFKKVHLIRSGPPSVAVLLPYNIIERVISYSRATYTQRNRELNRVPVHSKGDQPWDFFGRSDAKTETPVLWPPHAKSWLIGKDSDAGRDWRQEEKGTTEDEMAGGHHWLDGHESEWTLEVGDGQGGPARCCPWNSKESDMSERLN